MFHGLPPELQVECLKWLGEAPGRDWLHCCLASRIMFELCHDAALWHYFCCCQKVEAEKGRGMAAGVKDWKQHYLHRIPNHLRLSQRNKPCTLALSTDKLSVRQRASYSSDFLCTSLRKWTCGKHYFEVTILHTHNWIAVGIYGKRFIKPYNNVIFATADVIGVYLDIDAGDLLYFQNAEYLAGWKDRQDIREQTPYYAAALLIRKDEEVRFRFPPSIPSFVQQHVEATQPQAGGK